MAEPTFTSTGLDEMREGIRQLPEAVTARLRGVAATTAQRVLARARANWQALRKESPSLANLADAMVVVEDAANRQFIVESHAPKGRPPMTPIWIEYGTVKMPARQYMHPAATAEEPQYLAAMEAAAVGEAEKVFA